MSEFGLIKSFDIDSGELDKLSREQSFVLGYELASIDHRLKLADGFEQIVHADNRERLAKACADENREHQLTWMHGDASESWMMLRVEALPRG